jgi:chromosome segregation ATPase
VKCFLMIFECNSSVGISTFNSDLYLSRNLSVSSGESVRLLYDVIHCSTPVMEPAVQFAVSNCLVCETADTARHVAYELDSTVKYNVCCMTWSFHGD